MSYLLPLCPCSFGCQAILNGLRDSVADFSGELHGVSNKEIMELLLVTQCGWGDLLQWSVGFLVNVAGI